MGSLFISSKMEKALPALSSFLGGGGGKSGRNSYVSTWSRLFYWGGGESQEKIKEEKGSTWRIEKLEVGAKTNHIVDALN